MATALDNAIKPDHVIIWLDKNMCVPENNKSSKEILDNDANLHYSPSEKETFKINRRLCLIDPELNEERFDALVKSPLRMFTVKDECLKCIKDNIDAKKQPFLITSGAMGALIIEKVHTLLSGYIYIFCGQIQLHGEWIGPYQNDLVVYDDEKGVFARVLADIGIYYLSKGQNETENQPAAIQYLGWARQLFESATKLDNIDRKVYLDYVEDELTNRISSQSNGNDNEYSMEANDRIH